jgi:hypothetical protein
VNPKLFFASALVAVGCSSDPPPMTSAERMDPQACASCHPQQVAEWSGSMHAYAADDPAFVAMNARFQREIATSGSDSSLCVRCHAPLALQTGATTDGTNLASVDAKFHGVTCYVCHSASAVTQTHDDGLTLTDDGVMRGPISDPAHGASHGSAYSALHDLNDPSSSSLCGSCHDLQNGHGLDVERTFAEWQSSLYAQNIPSVSETCSACHMLGSSGVAATTDGAPQRRVHDHSLAAFDVALTSFPQASAQKTLVQQALNASIVAKLCVVQPSGPPNVSITLDNAFVGHEFPSGAAHDRRVWVEVHAFASGAEVFSSGTDPTATSDASLWLMRNTLLDASNQPVPFLWQAFSSSPSTLPPAVTNVTTDPKYIHSVTHTFGPPPETDRVTMIVHARAIGSDVLDDLVTSGDLDPSVAAAMPTFDLEGTKLEWDKSNGYGCVP